MSTDRFYLKQYGEMRSGTNVICALLNRNIGKHVTIVTHGPGSKHYAPDYQRLGSWHQPLHFLLSVRCPYSWMYGILHRSDINNSFGRQLIGDFYPKQLWNDPDLWGRLIARYNRHHKAWCKLVDDNPEISFVSRLEDIFVSHKRQVRRVCDWLGLPMPANFQPVIRECKPGKQIRYGGKFGRATFYLQSKHLTLMPDPLVKMIGEKANWNVLSKFGYERM